MSTHEAEIFMDYWQDLHSLAYELGNSDGDTVKLQSLYRRFLTLATKWPISDEPIGMDEAPEFEPHKS
jgi:hypothetical protein